MPSFSMSRHYVLTKKEVFLRFKGKVQYLYWLGSNVSVVVVPVCAVFVCCCFRCCLWWRWLLPFSVIVFVYKRLPFVYLFSTVLIVFYGLHHLAKVVSNDVLALPNAEIGWNTLWLNNFITSLAACIEASLIKGNDSQ